MTTFSVETTSTADVKASRSDVWARLTDPQALVRLTPLLTHIDAEGDTWVWHLAQMRGAGLSLVPCFTEHMELTPQTRITFSHRPPAGSRERIGVEGRYDLCDLPDGVHLAISLRIDADLPVPHALGSAVRGVMRQTIKSMGDRFSANLLSDLGA